MEWQYAGSGVARHGPSRARPDLLVTYRAYLIPFHKVLYTRLIEELEPCSLRQSRLARKSHTQQSSWLGTRPRKSANLTKQGLLTVRSMKVPREPILVTGK